LGYNEEKARRFALTPAYPPDTALILVAVMTSPRDLEIARLLGWYRIPFRHAPKVIDVDYLAFYQTANFGEAERWQIHYIAPVRGHELALRAELLRDEPDHPRAREEYYKIQIGSLSQLPHPIQARAWRRLTFLYSTGELLRQAESLNDLVVRDESRALLWQTLRERAMHTGAYTVEEFPEGMTDLDPLVLVMLGELGKIKEVSLDYD
jgi:hypothetical protein